MRPSLQTSTEAQPTPLSSPQSEKTRLGFGTAPVSGSSGRGDALRLLATAYEAGIRHFDTAPLYGWGEGEEILGEFAAGKDDIVVVTKAGISPPTKLARALARVPGAPGASPSIDFSPLNITRSVENSLRKLRVARLDVLLLHEPASGDVNDALVDQLRLLKREGKIARFGLATAPESTAAILDAFPHVFDIVQIPAAGAGRLGPWAADTVAIVHSVLGARLEKLMRRANATPESAARFEMDTGVSPADRDSVAKLLLRAAIARNPEGVTLFSSSRTETVKGNASVTALDAEATAYIATLLGE